MTAHSSGVAAPYRPLPRKSTRKRSSRPLPSRMLQNRIYPAINQLANPPPIPAFSVPTIDLKCATGHRRNSPGRLRRMFPMKSAKRQPIEFTANPNKPKPARENRQNGFLHFIAKGNPSTAANTTGGTSTAASTPPNSMSISTGSAAQLRHGNPDKPYKPLQQNSIANSLKNQPDASTKAPTEAPWNFSITQTNSIPARPIPPQPDTPRTKPPSPAAPRRSPPARMPGGLLPPVARTRMELERNMD